MSLPDAVGQVAVGGRVAELHRGGHAELREAGQLGGVEQLGVLDALAQAARPPGVGGGLERVEGGPVGGVPDRVHAHGPARRGGVAHDLGELLAEVSSTPEPSSSWRSPTRASRP